MKLHSPLFAAALAPALSAVCVAQSVNWAEFVRDDSRISALNSLVLQDSGREVRSQATVEGEVHPAYALFGI